jgi:hypothetical protein
VDGVTIYSGPDMSIVMGMNSGILSFNDVQIVRSPNPQIPVPGFTMPGTGSYRAISTDGDGMHLAQNWAQPVIQNCKFDSMADDSINILSIALPLPSSSPSVTSFTYSGGAPMVNIGDQIQVVDVTSGATLGKSAVSDTNQVGDSTYNVTLDSAITGFNSTNQYVAIDVSADGPNAVVRNNVFHTSVQSHGILSRSKNATITRNTFSGVSSAGIGLYATPGAEGPNPTGVTIKNNVFSNGTTGATDRASFAAQISMITPDIDWNLSTFKATSNITVDSNTFSNYSSGFPPVYVGASRNMFLNTNTVVARNGMRSSLRPGLTLIVIDSSNVKLNGVRIE